MNKIKDMPVLNLAPGEVFLQDKIVDEKHCYICGKEFNKFEDQHMIFLRISSGKLGFCCPDHRGVVQEFIRQCRLIPGGWTRNSEENIGTILDDYRRNNSTGADKNDEVKERNNKSDNRMDGTSKEHIRHKRGRKHPKRDNSRNN